MNAIVSLMLPVALVLFVALIGTFAWLFTRQRNALMQTQEELEGVKQSLSALCSGAVGVDRRMSRIEDVSRQLAERHDNFARERAADRPYGDAIQLVRSGASVAQLTERFGLSDSEAELLIRLHRPRAAG